MSEETQAQQYDLVDRLGKHTRFNGRKIGHSDSYREGKLQWSETTIYMTEGGKVIVHNQGKSVAYHRADAKCARGLEVSGADIDKDAEPCPKCEPEPWPEGISDDQLKFKREVTHSDVFVVSNADELQEVLYLERGGVKKISMIAASAVDEAQRNEPAMRDFIATERWVG